MLKAGDPAPLFTLLSDEEREVHLSDFLGRRIVLYFYPKADTPGCTKQACALRDMHPDIVERDIVVIGVSPDSPAKLRAFRKKHALPFVLLSDPERTVATSYGAWGEKKLYGRSFLGILRTHIAIDERGKIIEYDLKVKPVDTAELAKRLVSGIDESGREARCSGSE